MSVIDRVDGVGGEGRVVDSTVPDRFRRGRLRSLVARL